MSSRSTRRALWSLFLVYILIVSICAPPLIEVTASSFGAKRANGVVAKRSRPTKSTVLPSQSVPHGGRREGELLARFRLGLTIEQQRLIVASIGAKEWRLLRGESRVGKVMLHSGQTIESAIMALRTNRAVEFAEPNYLIHQDTIKNSVNSPSLPSRSIVASQSSIPNDPRFAEQWALQNLGGGAARLFGSDVQVTGIWQRSTGNPTVTVAILDSGIDFSHPDLRNQRWINRRETRDGKDEERDGFIDDVNGWDFVDNNNNLRDGNGHGTNVAGIIAAEGNNNIGIAGVMWQAGLMSLRVLDSNGVGDTASAIEALDYAGSHGAQVINLSWGSDERSLFLHDAIRRVSRYGSVVVCSAGNGARDSDTRPYYPASFNLPNLISVSASDGLDNLAQFSNFGVRTTTIAAPGVEILTTKAAGGSTADSKNGAYETISGTSASAAIVSGIVGLFKSLSFSIRAEQVKSLLMAGARKVPQLTATNTSGCPKLQKRGFVSPPTFITMKKPA